MKKQIYFLLLLIVCSTHFSVAQPSIGRDSLFSILLKSRLDTERIKTLLKLGNYYLLKPDEAVSDMDSALLFTQEAGQLSRTLQSEKWSAESDKSLGEIYVEMKAYARLGSLLKIVSDENKIYLLLKAAEYKINTPGNTKVDFDSALVYLNHALVLAQATNHKADEEKVYSYIGHAYVGLRDIERAKDYYAKAIQLNRQVKNFGDYVNLYRGMASALAYDTTLLPTMRAFRKELMSVYNGLAKSKDIYDAQDAMLAQFNAVGSYYMSVGKLKQAEDEFLFLVEISRARHLTSTAPYFYLVYLYTYMGLFDKALFYLLEMEKIAVGNGTINTDYRVLQIKASVYLQLGRIDQTIEYSKKSIAIAEKYAPSSAMHLSFWSYRYLVSALLKKNRAAEALAFLDQHVKGVNDDIINEVRGNCYAALGNYKEAEVQYLKNLTPKLTDYEKRSLFLRLASLYFETKQYEKSKNLLKPLLAKGKPLRSSQTNQEEASHLMFRIDSVQGNYLAAIRNLQRYEALHDSVFNTNKSNQMADMEFKYETEKKDDHIELLTKESLLQKADLQQARYMRNGFIIGGAVLFLILGLLYNQYRVKQKSNAALEAQQKEINQSNQQLQILNDQLQKLLGEKEWLVKEIHHRVKNNLQIVISLLNTQAAHLMEGDARLAINESQSRIQVISLLHQKLYKVDNSSIVDMQSYIPELVACIKTSFTGMRNFYFNLQIADIHLDISQAVPVGLILNEGITNAIKYAFLDKDNGTIAVTFEAIANGQLVLTIADNGKGLPVGFDINKVNTFGMKLMQTLSEQLDGRITFDSQSGVSIKITFAPVKEDRPLIS